MNSRLFKLFFCLTLYTYTLTHFTLCYAGQLKFGGVPVDITTADNEDLVIAPGTGGNIQIGDASGINTSAGNGWKKVADLHLGKKMAVCGEEALSESGMGMMFNMFVLPKGLNSKEYPNQKDYAQGDNSNHSILPPLSMKDRAYNKKTDSRDRNTDLHYKRGLGDKVTHQNPHYQKFEYIQKCFAQPFFLFISQSHHARIYHTALNLSRPFFGVTPGVSRYGLSFSHFIPLFFIPLLSLPFFPLFYPYSPLFSFPLCNFFNPYLRRTLNTGGNHGLKVI